MSHLTDDFRYWLRQQQAWNDLRTAQKNGWVETFRRLRTWPKILRTRPTPCELAGSTTLPELHTMCHGGDWMLVIWMLKSIHHFSGQLPPTVIHVQKQLKPSASAALRFHFPNARVVQADQAEQLVAAHLISQGFVRTLHWWHRSPIMHKLVTVQALCNSKNLLWLDSDILFFRRPSVCLDIADVPLSRILFQKDCLDSYTLEAGEARDRLGINLLPRINAGIVLRAKDAIALRQVEELLQYPEVAKPSGHIEQTLQALCACSTQQVDFLPESYALALDRRLNPADLVCRHYAGPSKRWLTTEGMRWLIGQGLLR
jgi:hypothetical protein